MKNIQESINKESDNRPSVFLVPSAQCFSFKQVAFQLLTPNFPFLDKPNAQARYHIYSLRTSMIFLLNSHYLINIISFTEFHYHVQTYFLYNFIFL